MAITTFSIYGKIFVISCQNANLKLILINSNIRVPVLLNLFNLLRKKLIKCSASLAFDLLFTPTCVINSLKH